MPSLEDVYASYKFDGDPLSDDMGGKPGRVHDWRNYADNLREIWPTLSRETRMAVAIACQSAADRENWDW